MYSLRRDQALEQRGTRLKQDVMQEDAYLALRYLSPA